MLTSGTLSGLQELLASWIAQDRSKHGHYFNSRIPKMAIYGALVSAPMGHFLIKILQWLFKDRTSVKAKVAMIAISNLFVSRTTFHRYNVIIMPIKANKTNRSPPSKTQST